MTIRFTSISDKSGQEFPDFTGTFLSSATKQAKRILSDSLFVADFDVDGNGNSNSQDCGLDCTSSGIASLDLIHQQGKFYIAIAIEGDTSGTITNGGLIFSNIGEGPVNFENYCGFTISMDDNGATNGFLKFQLFDDSDTGNQVIFGNYQPGGRLFATAPKKVVTMLGDGSNFTMRVNGVEVISQAYDLALNVNNVTGVTPALGKHSRDLSSGSFDFPAKVHDIIVYNSILDSAKRATVENYLMNKLNIS